LGYIGHSGGDAGVGTWMYFDKEKKTGRYIVINTDMGNDERA
jgi:CubicO group peptidase (beta-lactamase class C family)